MSKAKKCDRCGKFYEKNLETTEHGIIVTGVCFINAHDAAIGDKDLCDGCLAKFKRFMDGCELEN